MDYRLAFTYMFNDRDWVKKFLIGGLLILFFWLLIPGFIVFGYYVRTIRSVTGGADTSLPDWDDWGGLLVSGLKLAVMFFTYGIIASLILIALSAPFSMLAHGPLGSFAMVLLQLVAFVVNLIVIIFLPALVMQYSRREDFADAFKFHEVFSLAKVNSSDYGILVLLSVAVSWLGGVGVIFLIIGVAFTSFYALLVNSGLYGQYLRLNGKKALRE